MTEVSFPERSPHGTGLTPGWLQKALSKSNGVVVTTEFLGELFPLIMTIFASDGTSFLSRFFKMKCNTEFRL